MKDYCISGCEVDLFLVIPKTPVMRYASMPASIKMTPITEC